MPKQRILLEHKPDLTRRSAGKGHVALIEQHLTAFWKLQPGNDPQQGGLARARRPEQGQEFARFNIQTNPAQGRIARKLFFDGANGNGHGAGCLREVAKE